MELSKQVACTLTRAGGQTQRERWLALGESHGLGRRATEDGLRIAFRDDPRAREELDALVAVENGCCSWAEWTIEQAGDTLVMVARSEGTGVETLHGMFTQLA